MSYDQLVQLFFERSSSLQWYWTLYVVIVGGLLAFSSLRQRPDWITGALVTVLFCFFAYKNCGAIVETSHQRIAALKALQAAPATEQVKTIRPLLEPTLVTPDVGGLQAFHYTSDAITIAALWAMELRRIRNARRQSTTP